MRHLTFVGKDDKDDGTETPRKRRKKKKKKRGEEHIRQFEKFSSGSDGSENLEEIEYDSHDMLDHEDDDILFRSDHEFSCESDVPDDQVKPIKHARTAKKKRGRKPKVEETAVTSEEEDDDFACQACGKVSFLTRLKLFSALLRPAAIENMGHCFILETFFPRVESKP